MSIYADTNFLVFHYLNEEADPEPDWVRELRAPLPITWLARLEILNAIELSVFTGYGSTQRRITAEFAAACQQQFRENLVEGFTLRLVYLAESELARSFEVLTLRHTAKHGFRAYDILHVAAALALHCQSFWSFDKKASLLARLEGLTTLP
jgi:predicted nucleic acid-binding protein